MPLRFASLGSGSKGNGTLIDNGSTCVLIDLGFTHFVAEVVQPYDYEGIDRWYKEVAMHFKGQ